MALQNSSLDSAIPTVDVKASMVDVRHGSLGGDRLNVRVEIVEPQGLANFGTIKALDHGEYN